MIVGIDPGLTGAIAWIDGADAHVFDMPVREYWKRKRVDPARLRDLLPASASLVVVEQVNAQPSFGAAGSFSFGMTYGAILAVCDLLRLPTCLVRPQEWKKTVLPSADHSKAAAVDYVHSLYPQLGKVRHDAAEAVCLALYGRRHLPEEMR